jgi:alkanesulfonate monooxygenase SsuD/methylene tetrahydromethanopterin reductase-like flavin-dependent oxidoreductase (luciferase family)
MDAFDHKTDRWEVPFPHSEGIEWKMSRSTARLGAHGEIGPDGRLHKVAVVPAPYQRPHPPVFVASAASQETVEYCGRRGFIPAYFSGGSRAEKYGRLYAERAAEAGYSFAVGQNQAAVRWMQVGQSEEEARHAIADYDAEMYRNLYQPLTPHMKYDPADPAQSVIDCGLWTYGTADQIRDQLVAQWDALPTEYIVLIFHYAQQPAESVIRNMTAFMEHVKPALDELTPYTQDN